VGVARSDDTWITALALAAGAGDRVALTTFIRATQRDVYHFLTYVCAPDVAEDLTQETYLRALRALPSFTDRRRARTWLLSIARQVAADRLCTGVRGEQDVVAAAASAHRRTGEEDRALLRELVARLEADRRDAFVLTQVVALDYAAAAEVCGCPVSIIRFRVAQAREDLVCALNSLGWPDRSTTGP
jgi:RNA polymerase sigma-70 factor (ECF subfamily)